MQAMDEEHELLINPVVQESVLHNTKVQTSSLPQSPGTFLQKLTTFVMNRQSPTSGPSSPPYSV